MLWNINPTGRSLALGVLSAMEHDAPFGSDVDIKQDIAQDPLGGVESVYVPEEGAVCSCVPKVEVSSEDPLGDVERVYVSEEKAVSLCAPKVEVFSEDPYHELYGMHHVTQINKAEEIIFFAPKIEPLSPLTPAAEEEEDKGELSPECSKILPDTCLKEEIGQQEVLIPQTPSVHLTGETESPDDSSEGEVDLRGVLNLNTFLSFRDEKEEKFKCTVCNKEFDRKKALTRHQSNHLGLRQFSCHICLKEFTARSSLKTHLVIHTGERRFQCNICFRKFVRSSTLSAHRSIIHHGQKNFTCAVCSHKFSRQGDYRRHLQIHTGTEGKFECPTCHKLFTRTFNLKIHLRTHSGVKNYKCPTCLRAFLRADDLKRHLKIHTGEKNFECSVCHKKFDQRCNLNRHNVTHQKFVKGT